MLPYQRRSGSGSPRTSEIEVPRPPTRPIPIPRVASQRPSAPALHPAVPEIRPEFPSPHGDEELTVMMPSKSAAALPPPPDPRAARIPRQWSPVGQVVSSAHSSIGAQPTLPSLSTPSRSSVPTPPSSLAGMAFNDSTARVRTSALRKIARPTLSWAAALVALGIFVGIGSAVVSRNDVLHSKSNASAGEPNDKSGTDNKSATVAKTAPASSTTLRSPPQPPLLASAGAALAPSPLPGTAPAPPVGEVAPTHPAPVNPAQVLGDPVGAGVAGESVPGEAAVAQAVAAGRPNLPNDPANANAGLTPSPGAWGQAPVAQAAPRPRYAAPAPRPPRRAPIAPAEEEAPAAPRSADAKAAKKKEADLSKQAADLAAEQLGSLL